MTSYTLVINDIPTEDGNNLILGYNTNSEDSKKILLSKKKRHGLVRSKI